MAERIDRSGKPRTRIDEVHTVELACSSLQFAYLFRIWNLSSKGTCIVVRDDSEVLEQVKVGDVLEMKYYNTDTSNRPESFQAEIKHIAKDDGGRFKNHTLVGLKILE